MGVRLSSFGVTIRTARVGRRESPAARRQPFKGAGMAAINSGRVVTAGLLAGLVMNIVDTVANTVILKDDMMTLAQKMGVDPTQAASLSGALPWIVLDFVMGVLVVWTYAAIRPRFGPGPATALRAGFIPFAGSSLIVWAFMNAFALMPAGVFLRGTVEALISFSLGALAGGWAYREEAAPHATPARTV
jgi:hypothetical protein